MANNPWLTWREKIIFDLYYRERHTIEFIAAELDVCRRTVINDLRSMRMKTAL